MPSRLMCIEICIVLHARNLCPTYINKTARVYTLPSPLYDELKVTMGYLINEKTLSSARACNVFSNRAPGPYTKGSVMKMKIHLLIMDG